MISIGKNLTILESVDSTNNYAMAAVRAGLANHGDVFFAREQFKGKGQRNKSWTTERGANIIMSVVLHTPVVQQQHQFMLNVAVSLAAYDFFSSYTVDETTIKWPNDIYWRDRKAGGILIESIINNGSSDSNSKDIKLKDPDSSAGKRWIIVGLGININQVVFPSSVLNPVSLKQVTGRDYDVVEEAKILCGYLQKRYDQVLEKVDLHEAYNHRLYKYQQKVRLKKGSRVFDAVIEGVNRLGQLRVRTVTEEVYNFGEVEWYLANARE